MAEVMPDPVLVGARWLQAQPSVTAICGTRVSYKLGGTFPAVRLTDVSVADQAPEEGLFRLQVECWAEDYQTARLLAATVWSVTGGLRGAYPEASGWCAGGVVASGPFSNPDPESLKFRAQLDVQLWLFPLSEEE